MCEDTSKIAKANILNKQLILLFIMLLLKYVSDVVRLELR